MKREFGAVVVGRGGDVGVQRILRAYRRRLELVSRAALVNQLTFSSGIDEVGGAALGVSFRPCSVNAAEQAQNRRACRPLQALNT